MICRFCHGPLADGGQSGLYCQTDGCAGGFWGTHSPVRQRPSDSQVVVTIRVSVSKRLLRDGQRDQVAAAVGEDARRRAERLVKEWIDDECPECGNTVPPNRQMLKDGRSIQDVRAEFERPYTGPQRWWDSVLPLPVERKMREEKHSLIRKCKERLRATRPRRDS